MLERCVAFEKVEDMHLKYVERHDPCKRKPESQEAGAEADTAMISAEFQLRSSDEDEGGNN